MSAQSLVVLKEMDGALYDLANKNAEEMTRTERLQRRLIVAWLRVVEELMKQKQAVSAS